MASERQKILYQSTKARKPVITYPTSEQWLTNLSFNLEWKYQGDDLQQTYEVQISTSTSFTTVYSKTATSISSSVPLTDVLNGSNHVSASGTYYWRVRVTGTIRPTVSEWSATGTIKIDLEAPTIYGIDIIIPVGQTQEGNYAAEMHSNMTLDALTTNDYGYFIGTDAWYIYQLYGKNNSDHTRTFFGSITFPDLDEEEISAGYPVIEYSDDKTPKFWEAKDNKITFSFSLRRQERFLIQNLTCNKATYELHISDMDLYAIAGQAQNEYPKNYGNNELSPTDIKTHTFIGGAKTNPYTISSRIFTLIDPTNTFLPFGKNHYIDNTSGIDNSVLSRVGRNSFKTYYPLTNIKVGDYVWFLRSYDAYQTNPKNSTSLFSSNEISGTDIRDWFQIVDIDITNNVLTLDANFDSSLVNVKYPYESIGSSTYGSLPTLSTTGAYTVNTVIVTHDDNTTSSRYETVIIDATAQFQSDIYIADPTTSKPVGVNGISTRWIGIRINGSSDAFKFYAIYYSQDQQLTVIGDIVTDFASKSQVTALDYYITGDTFVITNNLMIEDMSDALVHIGAEDPISGVGTYALYKENYAIATALDPNGHSNEYVARTLPTDITLLSWIDYVEFFELKFKNNSANVLQEVFANVRDVAGNIAVTSFSDMPSQILYPMKFTKALNDAKRPSGNFWINKNEQDASVVNAIIDIFPIKENYNVRSFKIGTYPFSIPEYFSKELYDPGSQYITWQKWILGSTYNCVASKVETIVNSNDYDTEDVTSYFKAELSSITQVSNLLNVKYDIIGSLAQFIDDPSAPTYSIYDVWDEGKTLVMPGEPLESFGENSNITINTLKSSPSGAFSQGGLYAIYYNDKIDNFDNVTDAAKYITLKIDSSINFVDNIFSSELGIDGAFSVRWLGWFWTDYDAYYTLYIKGVGRVKLETEDVDGFQTLIAQTTMIPESGETTAEVSSESTYLSKGWHRIKCEYVSDNENGKIQLDYKSEVIDTVYNEVVNSETNWILPIISEIDSVNNKITLTLPDGSSFAEYTTNELYGHWALINLINAETGLALSAENDSINIYNTGLVMLQNGLTYIGINTASSAATLYINNTSHYFVQFSGDYPIYTLAASEYPTTGTTPSNYLLLTSNHVNEIKTSDTEYYRLGKSKLKVLSNTANTISFDPTIESTWTSALRSGDTLILGDSLQNWESNALEGLPVIVNTDLVGATVYFIVSNTQNTITITDSSTTASTLVDKDYRIGYVGDIAAVGNYIYTPIGTSKQVIPSTNLVRNAAKVYLEVKDFFGSYQRSMSAISLKGTNTDTTGGITGSIIEYNLTNDKYSVYSIGDYIYDANETEEIVAIYESIALSAPAGFMYWKAFSWDEYTPTGTSVTVYLKTAETEQELATAVYNTDAFGNIHGGYVRDDYDTPIADPTGIDISGYTTDGMEDSFGRIKRKEWIQFKIVLASSEAGVTPKVSNVIVSYSAAEERVIYTKNFELETSITQGFLTGNVEIPSGTEIIFGINTNDETDFNKYQIIPLDEAFDLLEPNTQYRIAAKIRSSSSATPKIYSLSFMHNTSGALELPNEDLE